MSTGIKTSISVNLAFLFLFAMGVTAFCALTLVRQVMVKKEAERALHLVRAVADYGFDEAGKRDVDSLRLVLGGMVEGSAVALVKVSLLDEQLSYGFGTDERGAEAGEAIEKAVTKGEPVLVKGSGMGLLGLGGAVVAAVPFEASVRGGVAAVVDTAKVSAWLTDTIKLLALYTLINLVVVTFAGVSQVSKVAVKPVRRLLAKAEDAGTEDPFLFQEEAGSEFSRLSMALNTMVSRINADREKLKISVRELKELNTELSRVQEDVVRAEKLSAMGRLASGVAHEIGNPLGIITGYLSLIQSAETDLERSDYIARTNEELSRIDGIIRQLLDFNRSGDCGDKDVVAVHDLITEIRELVRVQPLLKDINVRTNLGAHDDGVMATTGALRQVFLNLVLNAADAIDGTGRENGSLVISTRNVVEDDRRQCLEVVVEDNGGGISDADLPNIFDPFFSTKEPGQGTGLGLSVSFLIVEGLGGSLRAESRHGEGARMILCLETSKGAAV
ncbi:sensor histidine kinase [Desulfoluna butyratoxydans]|uniref:histidine kinase n=1 Tax=Desulfoluna butyratoxydans TaxID=231438 RepID=A0A4U8YHL2_9BACT|nr:ATP-binding protein [Desulfoluna butyratoxydans]VFQ42654.1 histidine kinase- dna gyrase b- and hsp90-like atpase [Desulfoluna butyratoxydans]